MPEYICPVCKGFLFSYDELEKDKIQQKRLTKWLENRFKKESINAPDISNVNYKKIGNFVKIEQEGREIGKIIMECELNFSLSDYGKEEIETEEIIEFPIGSIKIDKDIEVIDKNKKIAFSFGKLVDDKDEQTKFINYIKDLNIPKLNTTKLVKDLKNATFQLYSNEFKKGIMIFNEQKLICFLTISSYVSITLNNSSSNKFIKIGYVGENEENIKTHYNSLIVDERTTGIVCMGCGEIIEDSVIDTGPEWRAFDKAGLDKKSRASGAIKDAKVSKGLTTEIDRYDRDVKGGGIDADKKVQLYRIRKLQTRSRMSNSAGRNLSIALPELDRMSSLLNISENIKDECAGIYRKAVNKGYVKGRSIESIMGAIIYYVSRERHSPKTLEEISKASGISKKEIGRAYKYLIKKMNLRSPKIDVIGFISEYASRLGVSGEVEELAKEILKKVSAYGVTAGRGPNGVAASLIHLACEELKVEIDKNALLEMAGINLSTLINRSNEIQKCLKKN